MNGLYITGTAVHLNQLLTDCVSSWKPTLTNYPKNAAKWQLSPNLKLPSCQKRKARPKTSQDIQALIAAGPYRHTGAQENISSFKRQNLTIKSNGD